MMKLGLMLAGAAATLGCAAVARDIKPSSETPAAFRAVIDCRAITDPGQRLVCYDRSVATIEEARVSGDLIIADKSEIKEAKRGLFGFSLPRLKLFGDSDAVDRIDTTLVGAKQYAYGQWQFTVDGGAVWSQTDTEALYVTPKPGAKVTIKRAAMGSFMLKIGTTPAVRVRRVQ